jgi:copper chaperone CopZ
MKLFLMMIIFLSFVLAQAAPKEVRVSVKGMVCSSCVQGITKKFQAETAVQKVEVSLEKKSVVLNFKDGQDMPNSKIESLLKDGGYSVEKIER